VSFPLIGLVQLANYWLMLEVLRMQPSEVLSLFKNATGHSQGIVSAAGMLCLLSL
jgi:fatty acid synthase subunit beta